MFLVEQNAFHALKLAHRGYVMVNGLITLSGHRARNCWTGRRCKPPISKAGGRRIRMTIPMSGILYEEDFSACSCW